MTTFSENIRKMMGWCPQNKIVYRTEYEFISDYAYRSKTHADENAIHKGMDIPLQMFDWRIWAIILGFTGLIVFSIAWSGTYRYVITFCFVLIALLIIFSHTKLYIGNEVLNISTPLLNDIVIPKKSIKRIEIFENYSNKNYSRSMFSLVVMILLSIYFVLAMPDSVMNKLTLIAFFLFIYTLYFYIRISNYPDMIRMNVGGRYILLYPRNENDFLILKSAANDKLD